MNIKIKKNSSIIEKNCNYSAVSHRHINRTQNLHCQCKLTRIIRTYRLEIFIVLVIFNLIENTLGNPVFVDNPSIAQFQSGRNIRHLPCIVRKSGLSGTCMFAIDCIKQNGTHLGTCIDRFYFGSCCQMKEDIPYYAQDINDNSIDQNTISHFAHESSTVNIPQTSALFKLTTESLLHSSSESLLKSNTTNNKLTSQMPHVLNSTTIQMQNRETPTKPQKITINLITTYKPVTKSDIAGNLSSNFPSTSSTPSTLPSSADLLSSALSKNNSTSESFLLSSNVSESSSIANITSQVLVESDSLSIESLSSQSIPSHTTVVQSSSSTLLPTYLDLHTTTPNPDLLNPIQTSTNPVLTTTKTTEMPIKITTEETKFSTFQVVETTTPTIPSTSQSTLSLSSSSSPKLPSTTYKPSSTKQPIAPINVTNKPLPARRPTTHRTKVTRRPTTSTKPTVSSTAFLSTTRKSFLPKTTTVRAKPQQSSTTRRTTTSPKRTVTKRPTTISTVRPKPSTKRPALILTSTSVTTLPQIDVKNTTGPNRVTTQNIKTQTSPVVTSSTTTSKPTTTTPLPLVPAATKAPRPKPKPTANIIKVSPSIISDKVTDSISTIAPPSVVTNKPFLITGKPLTTKPIAIITQQSTKIIPTEIPTTPSSISRPILNSTLSKPTMTESSSNTESTTLKPSGLVTWTKVDGPSINNSNNHDDWIPRPPPDWVLLPTIKPDSDINKTLETTAILPPKQNVNTAEQLSNNSQLSPTSPQSIVTLIPETSSQFTHFVNQSTTEGLVGLHTENSLSSLNISTTLPTTANINSVDSSTTTTTPIPSLEGLDYKQICGKRMFPEPRIVGGANAAFGRWPWQISLRQWRTSTYLHKCGAALLNENWAITAAHCVDNVPPSDLLLRLGEYDLAEEEEPYSYQERRVQIVASHPQFDPRTFEYDLALLRFYEPVAFQPNIIPVCVPDNDYDFLEQTAYVTGWGRLYEDGPLPSVLQEVSVPVINNTICETMYRAAGYIEHIPHIFICAGWKKGGYDSCEGDSGGPMVLQRDDKRFVLGGVISWGIGCAEPNQPGVYTRISEFRDWINQILQF